MTVTAGTNCLTKAEDALADMLANSLAFRTWVSAASIAEAERHIFFHSLPESMDYAEERTDVYQDYYWERLGNYVILSTAQTEGFVFRFDAVTVGYEYLGSGELLLQFAQKFDRNLTEWQENGRAALNSIGDILESFASLGGLYPYLDADEFRLMSWGWTPEDQIPVMGLHFYVDAVVRWSSGQQQ